MRETPSVVPDRIEPVVAYRRWYREKYKLKSVVNEEITWEPLQSLRANHVCSCSPLPCNCQAPHKISMCIALLNCELQCGIYGMKFGTRFKFHFNGEVYLWGLIVEHELGYRAEYAYPKCLYLDGAKDDIIRMIASNYRIPAVEPPAIEPQLYFNSLVDLQRDTYNAISRNTGVQG